MKNQTTYIISFLTLRKCIGLFGIILPIILILGGLSAESKVQDSISDYYYTNMRDLFIGVLCAIGLFLISYKGYNFHDDITCTLGGIFAIAVAFFPTNQTNTSVHIENVFMLSETVSKVFHFVSAALFFIILAYISFFLFTKSDGVMTNEKRRRNFLYRICAIIMVVLIIGIGLCHLDQFKELSDSYCLVLTLEALALFVFGISWLVKGEAILQDN